MMLIKHDVCHCSVLCSDDPRRQDDKWIFQEVADQFREKMLWTTFLHCSHFSLSQSSPFHWQKLGAQCLPRPHKAQVVGMEFSCIHYLDRTVDKSPVLAMSGWRRIDLTAWKTSMTRQSSWKTARMCSWNFACYLAAVGKVQSSYYYNMVL